MSHVHRVLGEQQAVVEIVVAGLHFHVGSSKGLTFET